MHSKDLRVLEQRLTGILRFVVIHRQQVVEKTVEGKCERGYRGGSCEGSIMQHYGARQLVVSPMAALVESDDG